MSTIKVGDIVRRAFDFSCHWTKNKPDGDIFEVVEVTAHKDTIIRGSKRYFYTKNFSLVEHPNPPHKHKDLIIAWANGADIEVMDTTGSWCGLVKSPEWREIGKYRIKPTKSAKDVQIEELEAKAKELLDKITELKGSNG